METQDLAKKIKELEKSWKDLIVRSELSKLKEFNDLAKDLSDESTFKTVRSQLVFGRAIDHHTLLHRPYTFILPLKNNNICSLIYRYNISHLYISYYSFVFK